MRKLLHLVFAVWKTNRPFDPNHFPWEPDNGTPPATPAPAPAAAAVPPTGNNDKAVGHTQDVPAKEVVTTANAKVEQAAAPVNAAAPATAAEATSARPWVDYAYLREQITMEQLLCFLGLFAGLRGSGQQRRGCCPVHGKTGGKERTFSVHLGKNVFQCFKAECGVHGNALDLWAAVKRLPLYEAALNLAETFRLRRNREEEPVDVRKGGWKKSAVITTDGA